MSLQQLLIAIALICSSYQGFSQEVLSHFTSQYFEQQRFAHRGGYALGPENTLKTILANLENGVKAVEIDVQLSKDGQLILFHDYKLSRLLDTSKDLNVSDLTLSELQQIPLRDSSHGKQYIATFKELIDTLGVLIPSRDIKDFILEIDFKPHGEQTAQGVGLLIGILENQLEVFGDDLYNYFFVSTFYPDVLKELQRVNPRVVKAFAVNNSPDENKFLANLAILLAPTFVKKYNVKVIEPNMCMVDERFVRKWHKKGLLINAYTANTSCEKAHLEKFSIAYTTNCPDSSCNTDASDQIGKAKKWCKKCDK